MHAIVIFGGLIALLSLMVAWMIYIASIARKD